MIAVSLTTTMPTVKILTLDYDRFDLKAVLDFLKCFSCLERLYIYVSIRICYVAYNIYCATS